MSARKRSQRGVTVAGFCDAMHAIAPPALAQEWDNVGLLAGDRGAAVRRVLLCIDLTPAVAGEAVQHKVDLVMAYHPPIFRPVHRLTMPSHGTEESVFRCIRNGIAIYSTHTALDAAEGGTNDVIARLCGVRQTRPLEFVDEPGFDQVKLVVFVPKDEIDQVAKAIFAAGAGHIGDYSHCSYRIPGMGTFLGGESTNPTLGQRGRLEHADEIRMETVVPSDKLADVVAALVKAHSYEEPAFDIYPLRGHPVAGIGRIGDLPKPISLASLARKLKRTAPAPGLQIVGSDRAEVDRVVIVVGAAGSLPFRVSLRPTDVIITGEIRHHDALAIRRRGCNAIAMGHWASERPTLAVLADRLLETLPGITVRVSEQDDDPFQPV